MITDIKTHIVTYKVISAQYAYHIPAITGTFTVIITCPNVSTNISIASSELVKPVSDQIYDFSLDTFKEVAIPLLSIEPNCFSVPNSLLSDYVTG